MRLATCNLLVFEKRVGFRQNRRQKVFSRGHYVCAGGLDIINYDTTSLMYSVSHFNLGAWSFVWGDKSTKAPRGDGTGFRNPVSYKTTPICVLVASIFSHQDVYPVA